MERGAEIEVRNIDIRTPLHLSALYRSTEVAKLLLKRGVEIEARDLGSQTPLHLSVHYSSTRSVAEMEAREPEN